MKPLPRGFAPALCLAFALCLGTSCVMHVRSECREAGDPAREKPTGGTRQCEQARDPGGRYVNHGLYREWWPNGTLAIQGEYKQGKKDGLWKEWDAAGNPISSRYYDEGVEVRSRDTRAK